MEGQYDVLERRVPCVLLDGHGAMGRGRRDPRRRGRYRGRRRSRWTMGWRGRRRTAGRRKRPVATSRWVFGQESPRRRKVGCHHSDCGRKRLRAGRSEEGLVDTVFNMLIQALVCMNRLGDQGVSSSQSQLSHMRLKPWNVDSMRTRTSVAPQTGRAAAPFRPTFRCCAYPMLGLREHGPNHSRSLPSAAAEAVKQHPRSGRWVFCDARNEISFG
jgi:hypothetical protein